MRKLLAPLAVSLLLLVTGCGGSEAPAQETTTASQTPAQTTATPAAPEPTGPGEYTFQTPTGGEGTLQIPSEAPEIEEWREAAGGEPVTYITATFDNRDGQEPFDFFQVFIYDQAGNEYVYNPAEDYINDVAWNLDIEDPLYKQHNTLTENLDTVIEPLQKSDNIVMVGPPIPEKIAGVSVSNGFEPFPAVQE